MKNNKGMTLIEVVVSLLILSTASLIMVMGFTTAINIFSNANTYKTETNAEEESLLKNTKNGTKFSEDLKEAKYIIKEDATSSPIEVTGKYKKLTSSKEKDIALANFTNGKIDDTRKAYSVYKEYMEKMDNLSDFLSNYKITHGSSLPGTEGMDSEKNANAVNNWLSENGYEGSVDNVVMQIPKFYNLFSEYNYEIDELRDTIEKDNPQYAGNIKEENCYVMPCLFYNTKVDLSHFSKDSQFKYYKNVYIILGDRNNKNSTPDFIWAIYDNSSYNNETDTWLIAPSPVSSSYFYDKTNDANLKQELLKNGWKEYTTQKGSD